MTRGPKSHYTAGVQASLSSFALGFQVVPTLVQINQFK